MIPDDLLDIDGFCRWVGGVLGLEDAPAADSDLRRDLHLGDFDLLLVAGEFEILAGRCLAPPDPELYASLRTVRSWYLHYATVASMPPVGVP